MSNLIIKPKAINKENFKKFGDMITTDDIKPLEINDGYAKRYDGIANLDAKKDNGESTISIFSALKRSFPMKETTFLAFVAPQGDRPDLNKAEAFIVPKGIGINYNSGVWHFPLIATEDMDFLVVDRKGEGDNLVLHDLNAENITLEFQK